MTIGDLLALWKLTCYNAEEGTGDTKRIEQ